MTACHDEPPGCYQMIRVARSAGLEAGTVAAVMGYPPRRRWHRDQPSGVSGRAVVPAGDGSGLGGACPDRVAVRADHRAHRPTREPRRGRAARPADSYLNDVYELRPLPYAESGYGHPESGQTVVNVTNAKLISPRGRPIGLAHHAPLVGKGLLGALIEHPAPIRITDITRGRRSSTFPQPIPRSPVSSANRRRPRFGTATSGVGNSSALRGRPRTRLDGSFACPPSTSGPALRHDGDLRTRRAHRLWIPRCTAHLLLRPGRPDGGCATTTSWRRRRPNGHPDPADRRHRPAHRWLTDGP
jgi:hypothetical protein